MESKLRQLCEWSEKAGACLNKLEFRKGDNDEGYGVYAKRKTNKDECLASIPYSLAITEKVARESLKDRLINPLEGPPLMCLFLIYERWIRAESSFWVPYINCLPQTFSTPFYFNDQELQFLKATPLELITESRYDLHKRNWQMARDSISTSDISEDVLSWENYLWAANVYSSRAFPISLVTDQKDECKHNEALLPLLDMLNHKPGQPITWNSSGNDIEFILGSEFEAGQQVFNNYGPKSNQELLMGYGFCIQNNPQDIYHVRLNYSKDPEASRKKGLLEKAGIDKEDHYIRDSQLLENSGILPFMRVMVMNDIELSRFEDRQGFDSSHLEYVSLRNEIAALNMLGVLLSQRYNALLTHKNSNGGDEGDLAKNTPMSINSRNAVIYREGIERILISCLSKIKTLKSRLLMSIHQRVSNNEVASLVPKYLDADTTNECELPYNSDSNEMGKDACDREQLERLVLGSIISQDSFDDDRTFSAAINTMDVDIDTALALYVLRCRYRRSSRWYELVNQYKKLLIPTDILSSDQLQMLEESYNSLFPGLSDQFPKLFSASKFTLKNFLFASSIVLAFSVRLEIEGLETFGLCLA